MRCFVLFECIRIHDGAKFRGKTRKEQTGLLALFFGLAKKSETVDGFGGGVGAGEGAAQRGELWGSDFIFVFD